MPHARFKRFWWLVPLAAFLVTLERETGGAWPRLFLAGITLSFFGALSALVGRPRIALNIATLLPLLISVVGRTKAEMLQRPLLWNDLKFLLSGDLGQTLWNMATPTHVLSGIAGALLVVAYLHWVMRHDLASNRVRVRGLGVACASILIALPSAERSEVRQINPILKFRHPVSTFLLSIQGLRPELRPMASESPKLDDGPTNSKVDSKPPLPDLFGILAESVFNPFERYGLPETENARRYFHPPHGTGGRLRVETFGGGTWISSFSFLSGLSGRAFGDEALYLPYHLENKVHDALPAVLKKLGYRTIVFFPVEGTFVNAKKFYLSMGFEEFYEPADLGWNQSYAWQAEDRKFYQEILKRIRSRNQTQADRPLFIWLRTVLNHIPHGPIGCYDCSRKVHFERLTKSLEDFRWFENELSQLEGNRPYSVLHFGDHLPPFVKEGETSNLYETYFAITGNPHHAISSLRGFERPSTTPLDLGFLSGLWLEALKMPLDGVWRARNDLARRCHGVFLNPHVPDCHSRAAELHHRMVQDGRIEI